MKRLFPLLAALLSVGAAFGQSSNLVQALRLTFTDNLGVTNNTSITLTTREAEGFFINYLKDVQTAVQQTNAPPTFQNSIRGTVQTMLLNPLAEQARANERKTNRIDTLFLLLPSLWDSVLTSQQRADLKALAAAPNVSTNLPAQ